MSRLKSVLIHPDDLTALKEKFPKHKVSFCILVGFPVMWINRMPVYIHARQPKGSALKGPEDEIRRTIREWEKT